MARRYNIQGTNDFLVWAFILFTLGAWCLKDGWFPSEAKLAEHPREVQIKAHLPGMVKDVFVNNGDLIRADQPIVRVVLTSTNAEQILKAPIQGYIASVPAKKNDVLSRDQVVAIMTPEDTFYSFNKSLAFIALLGALICGVVHFLVR